MKHRFLIGTLFALFITVNVWAQTKKTYFAIGLFAGAHSSLVTYAFLTFIGDECVGAEVVRKDRFMYAAFGYWPSPANPKRENLFEKYNVDSCYLLENDFNKIVGYYCPVFDDLWKLRFYEHPMEYDLEGWSQGQYKPSIYQAEILRREYGINNVLTDYIYGDSLFKLLRDIQRPEWVWAYRFAAPVDSTGGSGYPDTTSTTP